MEKREKVAVGFSGGVDSTAAIYLLKQQGYQPVAITFDFASIFSKKELTKIKSLAKKLAVKHLVVKKGKLFEKEVVNYFLKETKSLKTPNPCIICNPNFKIKELLKQAKKLKISKIATGHYAQVAYDKKNNYFYIAPAKDKAKDQSYFLTHLKQNQLKYLLLPLSQKTKSQAQKIYQKFAPLPKQSQNLCFLAGKDKSLFIAKKLGKIPCQMVLKNKNQPLKKCQNIYNYTLGQRKGLGLAGGPFYVVGFDKRKDLVILSKQKKDILDKEAILDKANFFDKSLFKKAKKINILAKARYQMDFKKAVLKKQGRFYKIIFKKPVFALTPGQFVAFYSLDKKKCLGGARINKVLKNEK